MARSRSFPALPALFVLAGCGRDCKDHPYVPYAVGDGAAVEAHAASPSADAGEARSDGGATSRAVPRGAVAADVAGGRVEAPPGRTLLAILETDLDGDGRPEVLVALDGRDLVELAHYASPPAPGGASFGPPRIVTTARGLPTDPSCEPVASIERVGARSVAAELGVQCQGAVTGRRRLAVLRAAAAGAPLEVRLGVTALDPPAAARLTLKIDGRDADGDGVDDVEVRMAVQGGAPPFDAAPRVEARATFVDRPAGLSRLGAEPEASLAALAREALVRAGKSGETLRGTPLFVHQVRVLARAICDDAGAPRLVEPEGAFSLACGKSRALDDLGLAEVRAYAVARDPVRALAAYARAERPPAAQAPDKRKARATAIFALAPRRAAPTSRSCPLPAAEAKAAHPTWGPFAFEPSGSLLVRAGDRVRRLDPATCELGDTDVRPWESRVVSPDGAFRWLEAYHACDGAALRATFVATGAADVRDVAVPVPASLGARCQGARGDREEGVPLAWDGRGLAALVDGEPVSIDLAKGSATTLPTPLGPPGSYGSPRSPLGKALSLPTALGVLLLAPEPSILELEAGAPPTFCTVRDDASLVACLRDGAVAFVAR